MPIPPLPLEALKRGSRHLELARQYGFEFVGHYDTGKQGLTIMRAGPEHDLEENPIMMDFYKRIFKPSFPLGQGPDLAAAKKWLSTPNGHVLLAFDHSGKLIGGATGQYLSNARAGFVGYVAIDPEHRSARVGTTLGQAFGDFYMGKKENETLRFPKLRWILGESDVPSKTPFAIAAMVGHAISRLRWKKKLGLHALELPGKGRYLQAEAGGLKEQELQLDAARIQQRGSEHVVSPITSVPYEEGRRVLHSIVGQLYPYSTEFGEWGLEPRTDGLPPERIQEWLKKGGTRIKASYSPGELQDLDRRFRVEVAARREEFVDKMLQGSRGDFEIKDALHRVTQEQLEDDSRFRKWVKTPTPQRWITGLWDAWQKRKEVAQYVRNNA